MTQHIDVTLCHFTCNTQILRGTKNPPCALGGKLKVNISEYTFLTFLYKM